MNSPVWRRNHSREAIHRYWSNQACNQASFRLKRQRSPPNASGDGDTFPDPLICNIVGHLSCTSELDAERFEFVDHIKFASVKVQVSHRLSRSFSGAPNLGFVHVQSLLSDSGETTSDFQRNIDVTNVLTENSSVVSIHLRRCCRSLSFHSSGPRVHQQVEKKNAQGTTLNDPV